MAYFIVAELWLCFDCGFLAKFPSILRLCCGF